MLHHGKVECSGGFLLVAALLFYLDRENLLPWIAAAAALHELGHYVAVRLTGGRVQRLHLSLTGADMKLDPRHPISYGGGLAVLLAGPASNLLLALLCIQLGRGWDTLYVLAGLSLSLGCFNLMPIYPLDGGRALLLILTAFLPPHWAQRVAWGCSMLLVSILLAAGGSLLYQGGDNPTLLCMALWLLSGLLFQRKDNEGKQGGFP